MYNVEILNVADNRFKKCIISRSVWKFKCELITGIKSGTEIEKKKHVDHMNMYYE